MMFVSLIMVLVLVVIGLVIYSFLRDISTQKIEPNAKTKTYEFIKETGKELLQDLDTKSENTDTSKKVKEGIKNIFKKEPQDS